MRRSQRTHSRQKSQAQARTRIAAGLVLATTAVLVVAAVSFLGPDRSDGGPGSSDDATEPLAAQYAVAPAIDVTETASAVEVPDVAGKTLAEAQVILSAIGVTIEVEEDAGEPADAIGDARIVLGQDPIAGAVVDAGATVCVRVPAGTAAPASSAIAGAVVVIDPGHQSRGDSSPEPVGPGAQESKPRVTGGTTGTVTRIPEYEVVLQISMNLKARLEAAGATVLMTRTTNDVNLSNSERAAVANDARADLFVRVHADGSVDSSRAGISTLYPGENRWTGPIAAPSRRAATLVHEAVIASTGAASLGTVPRTDLAGFNWSRVPAVLVECGFMTNPVEDRLLASPNYQDKLADGIATGIMAFLSE